MGRLRTLCLSLSTALALFMISACGDGNGTIRTASAVGTQVVASGFSSPLDLEQSPDNSGRLFVVEQGGTIKIIQNGSVLAQPFLNISAKVITDGEMGLLGVTFHPSFSTNRK